MHGRAAYTARKRKANAPAGGCWRGRYNHKLIELLRREEWGRKKGERKGGRRRGYEWSMFYICTLPRREMRIFKINERGGAEFSIEVRKEEKDEGVKQKEGEKREKKREREGNRKMKKREIPPHHHRHHQPR